MRRLFNFFSAIDKVFAATIRGLLIFIILAMVAFVAVQIVLRNIFDSGIPWAEVAARHSVLWVGFLGAMLATRSRQHISIDVLVKTIPRKARNSVRIGIDLMACIISALLAKAAFNFVVDERAMGSMLFMDVPAWWAQVVIPFGFAMIAIEYAIGIGLDIYRIAKDSEHVAGKGRE